MKTLTRTTLASVAVLSVLAGCAPAKRATNKPNATTNANPASQNGLTPFQNTQIVNADAHLPTVPPTDTTVPAGTINLMTTTKGQPLVVNLDNNFNATTTNNQLSGLSFKCTTVPAQATLDKCADMELDLSLTGTDNKPHAVQVLVTRRGLVNVDEKVVDPKNPTATGAPENPKFGTAFYQVTQTSVDKNAFHLLEIAYITTPVAKSTDVPQGTGLQPWGPANQVVFYIKGALVDTSNNAVACVQTVKNGTACGPDTTVAPIDKATNNLIMNASIQMSDKSLKTVLLTVQDRNSTDPNAAPNGSSDTSTMISTVKSTADSSGNNPAPSNGSNPAPTNPTANPPAPATNSAPAAANPVVPANPAAPGNPPAAPVPAPANNSSNPQATGAGGGNSAAPAINTANPGAPDTDAAGNFKAPPAS